ncbi:hypothetical protein Tco_0860949 [Tanacetum coccineum]|uniref:Uncharacterized protein n=1 Tax=Tanacetum coccineum TaxID=301880 RepID=A0ABQ5BIL5_9ASTR
MKSITEGPFQMGTMRDTLLKEGRGLSPEHLQLIINFTEAKDIRGNVEMIYGSSELTKCLMPGSEVSNTIHLRVFFSTILKNQTSIVIKLSTGQGSTSADNLIEILTNTLSLLNQSFKAHLPQMNNQLRTSLNARNNATVQEGRVVVQDVRGRYNVNNQGRPFQRNNARGNVVAGNARGQNRGGNDSDYFKDKMLLMQAQENGAVLDEEQLLFLAREQVTNFDDDVDDPNEKDLALNVDHIFEADQCDAFDSDVDDAPTTQTMFMVNLSSEDPIYDEAGPSL